ncbi:MAG TPA: Ig-like domain-containing protein, partial [Aggregatilineales bacterium]|nr:Ig-like domain-containing protein [Aggregatilineales bacterium]
MVRYRWDRLDAAMVMAMISLLVVIGEVIARGDQLGIRALEFRPVDTASSRTTIQVQFEETVDLASVRAHFRIAPAVAGDFSVQDNRVTFRPSSPLPAGKDYAVTLTPGIVGVTGREFKQVIQWHFRVAAHRVIYLAPAFALTQNLYAIDPAQPDAPQQLTDVQPATVVDFDVAPDGSSIVFAERQPGSTIDLMMWDAASGTSRLFYACRDAQCTNPVWRPDGGAIAFERVELNTSLEGGHAGVPRVWIYDLVTNSVHLLFNTSERLGYAPHWSPDGKRIAVYDDSVGGIVVHDFSTRAEQVIKTVQGIVGAFSPDGRWLFFPRKLQFNANQYATHQILVDTSTDPFALHSLIPDTDPSDDSEMVWTPDTTGVIVARRLSSARGINVPQIYEVNLANGQAVPLVVDESYASSALSLSPDGALLASQRLPVSAPNARNEVWLYDLKNHQLRRLASDARTPKWMS